MKKKSGRRGKRKHLASSDCLSLSNSSVGAFSLTQPFSYMGTGRDLHRGLYPKSRKAAGQLCHLQRQQADDTRRPSEDATSGEASVGQSSSGLDFAFDPKDFLSSDASIENDVLVLNSNSSRKPPVLSPGCSSSDSGLDRSTRSLENAPVTLQQNNMRAGVTGAELEVEPLPDSYFGLLGCTGSQALPSGHISQLPDEMLRAVFCHLPAVDLYGFRLVCQQWRRVLSDPMFVPWKRLYYRYRKGERSAMMEVDRILKENKITKGDKQCILNLVRYVASFQHARTVNSEAVLDCLKDHPVFNQSKLCINQILPDVLGAARTISTWAILAVIVLLSGSVQEIQTLISSLGQPCSTLPPTELMEVLYCIATLLFALGEKDIGISNRIHYNLFCALYLRENPVCRKQPKHVCSPDSSRLERDNVYLSSELERVLNYETLPDGVIKIMGLAGTGKTSLLITYARHRPHLHFLFVLPNKLAPEEVSYHFPPNVECTTMHTKAYQCIGYKYHQKKKLIHCGLKPFAVSRFAEGQGGLSRASLICRILSAFFSSADASITVAHVPDECKSTYGGTRSMEHHEKLELVGDAERIWKKMVDLHEPNYFMTHDGYLKLWQLSKPNLSQFDVLLLDEAEDCSPAIMDIILSQKCGKILVGDPHQQISNSRSPFDALCEAHHPQLFSLTQSFRFGPQIAYVAATILEVCKQVKDKTLVGGNEDGNASQNSVGQVAVLCKTTAAVFDEAVRIVTSSNPTKMYFIGGLVKFGMSTILDIWMLTILEKGQATNLVIRDPFIRMFEGKGGCHGLRKYAVQAEDSELEEMIAVVEKYSLEIPTLVEKITNLCVNCPSFASVVLGTVHKAKGLEFDTVQIAEDIIKVPGFRHNPIVLSQFKIDLVPCIDWNLLYIAVTRAKRRLVMSRSLECLLSFASEYFLKPELTTNLLDKSLPAKCYVRGCLNHISREAVLTMRKASSLQCAREGPLCSACARQRIGPLIYLLVSPELGKLC
ncbi:F-box DNA helicase 1 isoform X2 [Hypanus sabinus]|uniref:F-box DNA helicase 1 isoform X2 n=1 Tax=Hypanus sabinus TaxID=79690 RepID=UPI0028C4AB37|nr:F-box DNA helicase 1 isoform X2 [Hypanus sabinus]